jgi:hypothetical protein
LLTGTQEEGRQMFNDAALFFVYTFGIMGGFLVLAIVAGMILAKYRMYKIMRAFLKDDK